MACKRQKYPNITLWLLLLLAAAGVFLFPALENRFGTDEDGYPSYLPGSGVEVPAYVREDLIPVNQYSRPGRYLRQINGIVIHYVGNPGSTAKANRNYFASLSGGKTGTYASSHFIVGLDGEVIQCVPLTEVSYASNQRNGDTVAIEVCHPDAGGKFSDTTYNRVVELAAWLCHTFHVDPETDVIRHYDVTGKICPRYYVNHPEAWERLRGDIAAEKAAIEATEEV